jgi:hypothetical protein
MVSGSEWVRRVISWRVNAYAFQQTLGPSRALLRRMLGIQRNL